MTLTTIHAAKTHLSRLIQRACNGEDFVIARGKTPLVHLVPVNAPEQGRRFGPSAARPGWTMPSSSPCRRTNSTPGINE